MKKQRLLAVTLMFFLVGLTTPAFAQTIETPFDSSYSFIDLGSVPDLPPSYGGLTIKDGDFDTLLIGGDANTAEGKIYAIDVVRDSEDHIVGFSGVAVPVIDAGFNNGGVTFGPDGVLFLARWPENELGQVKPGSPSTDKIIDLDLFGVTPSPGGVTFVPPGFPQAGHLKMASWEGGQWYDATLTPDGFDTFDIDTLSNIPASTLPGGPEGFIYVPMGSPEFSNPSILVSEWSAGNIAAYEIDGNSDPIIATRQTFMSGLDGAEGAFIDPLTGDFLFSTFGGGDRVIVIQGFLPPPPTIVAGETLPIDTTILFLAGISQSAAWMIPTLAGLAGAGVIIRHKLQS